MKIIKRSALGLLILAPIVHATQYIVVIDQNNNNYQPISVWMDWFDTNAELYDCSNLIDSSSIHYGFNFENTKTCSQEQKRISNDGKNSETRIVQKDFKFNDTGNYHSLSCNEISQHSVNNLADNNGLYTIFTNNGAETVYCDMVNGKWTLLLSTGTDKPHPTLIYDSVNKNNPPTTINFAKYDYQPYIDDFRANITPNTILKFECKDYVNGTKEVFYHKNIKDITNYFNITASYPYPDLNCSSNENFSGGYSDTTMCLKGNDSFHRYYNSGDYIYGWAHYNADTPAFLRHCGDTWVGVNTTGVSSTGYIWFK